MAKVIFDGVGEMPELNRITAKKNYASSSQAHKMGATAMFNDILHYLGKEKYPKLINEVGGQVAVRQHPVYAFQKIPIEGSEGQYNKKFIGLFTVGPDKGDKNFFGFTNSRIKDRAIRLEGTDHLKGVGFNYPWTVNGVDKIKYNHAEESLCIVTGSDKTKWTKIWEQSVCGDKETEAEIEAYLKELYKPAYEVAYYNNPLIVGVDMTLSEINSNIEAFGKRRRIKDDRQYSYCEFWIDGEYDIYYLDAQTNKYEKNGINLLSDLAITPDEIAGMTIEEKNDLFISRRVARFKEEAKHYFCIDDAIYQLMFLFIIVASDNFEKNMYPYIMELLWRFFQDDLDSIFSTDNQAQNTKKYSAEIHDFTDDTKSAYVFKGEDSAFWQLIELAYPDECKQMGRDIFQAMYDLSPTGTTTMEKLMGFFDEYFFNRAQKYFAPSAYNNDTEYAYEEAWNNKEYVASVDIHPLAQALGSQESTERAFLEKRLIYLMSKFGFGGFNSATDTDLGIISVRTQDPQSFTLTPAIDLYPTVLGGQAQSAVATERIMAGQPVTLPAVGGGNTNVYIVGADWLSDIGDLKDLKVDPSSVVTLTISSKRLRRIKVGDENADSVTSYLGSLSIQKCDSLETIDARNLQTLVGTVDLSNCPRLVEALFGGSNANVIIIAPGSKVEKLQFSDSITTIDLRNNIFLKDVEITNFAKIRFLRLENVPIINGFDILRQAYNTDGQQLENIRIIGFTYTGVADDLLMLNNIAEGKDKDGNAHNYGAIDANGDPIEDTLPIIEGSLHITEPINRTTVDFVKGAFHALALTADNIVDYVVFADPEVSRIVAENWGDGIGTSLEQIQAVNNIGTVFKGNTVIETFDEFGKFINAQSIPKNAFQGDTALRSIDLSKAKVIEYWSFYNCSALSFEDLKLPELERIGEHAFYNVSIKKISDLGKITTLPTATNATQNFGKKDILKEVVLPNELIEIPSYSFYKYTNLFKINIPTSIEVIREFSFADCTSLEIENLDCPNLKSMYKGIFRGTKIKKVSNLGSVTYIPGGNNTQGAFVGCSELSFVSIPDSCTDIQGYSFYNCVSMNTLLCRPTTPPTLGISAIDNTNNCPIYVPDASVEAYKTATNWVTYADRIMSMFYYLGYIDFVDPAVRDICVANFDTDGDGVVSIEEAAAVTDIGTLFKNANIQSFDEFKYFTGITSTPTQPFKYGAAIKKITIPESVEKLGDLFLYNTQTEYLTIPKNVTSFSRICLSVQTLKRVTILCNKVITHGNIDVAPQEFVVNEDNTALSVKNGSLYSKDGTTLHFAVKEEYGHLDLSDVVTLNNGALNSYFTTTPKVTIPSNVINIQNIGYNAPVTHLVIEGKLNNPTIMIQSAYKLQYLEFSYEGSGADSDYISFNRLTFGAVESLETLIIKCKTLCPMTSSENLNPSKIKDGTGYIYVPDNLVEDYKVAANWSTYASQIKGISEMPIEFEDPAVEAICLANWDSDSDGVFTIGDAEAVTDIGTAFQGNTSIVSFDEFKYFTGVTNLADGAFNQCTKIKELRIPDGVTQIGGSGTSGQGAISNMTSLETLHWGKNITKCNGLNWSNDIKNIYVYDNANYLKVAYGRGESNPLCESKEYVNLFVNGVKTTEFVIPEGVTNIPSRTNVLYKLNINKIHIPASLTTFNLTTSTSGSFLKNCPPVEFEVDSSNESFTSINGVLYDKSVTTLYRAAGEGEELIIPSSVTYIVENCASYSHYKKIKVHSGITRVGSRLFGFNNFLKTLIWESTTNLPQWTVDECNSLETILIKADIKSIGNVAFNKCSNLRNLIVDSRNLVSLTNWGSDTGFNKGIANAYVQSDLVDSYKTATTWSTYADKIKPINVADTLPDIGSVVENDLYKIGEVYWKAEMVDNVLTWVEI